jgi:hypothetical protein
MDVRFECSFLCCKAALSEFAMLSCQKNVFGLVATEASADQIKDTSD